MDPLNLSWATVTFALTPIVIAWVWLRLLDWASGGFNSFRGNLRRINENPVASAVYFGFRFLAVAILLGNVLHG